jgi:hypothetical protein
MRALGRFDRADDILTNIIDQTQRTVIRAEKNKVAKTFLRFAQANPSPYYKIGLAEKKRRIDPITQQVEEYWSNLPANMDRVFGAKVGGKTYYIEILHEGLLEGLKNLGDAKMIPLFQLMARLTREYSRFQTGKNPEFFFTNLLKDIQDAGFTINAEQRAGLLKRYAANLANGKALFAAVLGVSRDGKTSNRHPGMNTYINWYNEWREAGGKISHYALHDLETLRRNLGKELNRRMESTTKAVLMAPLRALNPINGDLVKLLEAMSEVTESTTRLAVYISAREVGMSKAQAAQLSRNASVDFQKGGKYGSILGALYAFSKANIGGNVRLLRTLRKSKIARRAALGIVVAGMLMTFWNMAVSPEDKDKKKAYEKRKYWERERNIIIYWPGKQTPLAQVPVDLRFDIPFTNGAFKIPLGYGLNVFWMMGEQIAMRMLGKVDTAEALGNVVGTTASAFNPTGSQGSFFDLDTWTKAISPTILRWMPELALNSDFAGRKIHPDEMPWTKGIPHSSQHKAFTHPAAVGAAEMLNSATGGNKFEPGKVDLYPDDLEYGWNFVVGGLGRFISNTSGTVQDAIDGVPRPVERIPFIRRFIASDNSPAVQSDAYYKRRTEEANKAQRLRAAVKARTEGTDDGSADGVIERLAGETGAKPGRNNRGLNIQTETIFRGGDKSLKALRSEADTIRRDKTMSRADKKTQIEALNAQMRDIMDETRGRLPAN